MAEGLRWLESAHRDLEDAQLLAQGESYAAACFHCQQAAEKALKGLLYSQGARAIITHSILTLLEAAAKEQKNLAEMTELARELDRHYIASRYPNFYAEGGPSRYYTREMADQCIKCATSILNEVTRFLSK